MKGGGDAGGEIEAVYGLASLIQGLAAAHEAGARIEGKPEGEAFDGGLGLAPGEIDFGQFADVDLVFGQVALILDVSLGHEVHAVIGPVLGEEAYGVGFGGH